MTNEQNDEFERISGLIRALSKCREAATDPVQIEIIRAATNRATEQLHDMLRAIETDDLYRMSGIDALCANILATEAVARTLEAMKVPEQEPTT